MATAVPVDAARPPERLDLRGLKCPLPVLKATKRLGALLPADLVEILADDPLAAVDIPNFCRERGHDLMEMRREAAGAILFRIRRGTSGP